MQIRVEVCDVCGDREKEVTGHYRIAPPGQRLKTYAFCAEDEAQLKEVLGRLQPAESKMGRGNRQVTSMTEVQAARKGTTRKRAVAGKK